MRYQGSRFFNRAILDFSLASCRIHFRPPRNLGAANCGTQIAGLDFIVKGPLTLRSIFLSHSSIDKPIARQIAEALKNNGVKVWLDEAEIDVGDSLVDKISEGLNGSEFVGAILSSNSINSKWVKQELEISYNREIREGGVHILPIVLDNCEIPTFLTGKLYADFRTSFSDGMNALLGKLSSGRRIDTPHHPIIRSYEVPISSSSYDQVIGFEQKGKYIYIQWSESSGNQNNVYIHKVEKKTLELVVAVGFELPSVHWGGFIRQCGDKIYSINICEIEFHVSYSVWILEIDNPTSGPEFIGTIANSYIDDVEVTDSGFVLMGVSHGVLKVDILQRGYNARSYSVPAPAAQGTARIVKDDVSLTISYITASDVRYHRLGADHAPGDEVVQSKLRMTFDSEIWLYNNCAAGSLFDTGILAAGEHHGVRHFDFIEVGKTSLKQSIIPFFDEIINSKTPFKHSFSMNDDVFLVTWNSKEDGYKNAILSAMLFDRNTLRPLWSYERTLTSYSNYATGIPIVFSETMAYLAYIEEAVGQFKVKLSEIDVSARRAKSARVKRWT